MRLRVAALAVVLPAALPVQAQQFIAPVQAGIRLLQSKELLPLPQQVNPTQPTGFPNPTVRREGDLPREGAFGPEGGVFKVLDSGDVKRNGNLIHATGGIEFTDRGYHCWADEVFGDTLTSTYTLKGNVRVLGESESIYGDLVQVNFAQKTFVAEDSEATLKPDIFSGMLRDNLYVRGTRSYGSAREVWGEDTAATTCSYEKPHYEIVAHRTDLRPGRRIIFRKVKLNILGHTILALPYLSIPLDERGYNNLPQVGHGTQEGYFIKTRWGIGGSATSDLDARVDYYTRLGIGLGADYRYQSLLSRGILRVFTIQGPHQQLEIIGQHRQDLRWGTLSVDGSYENDNYLISSNSKILNTRAVLLIPQGRSSNRITFYRTSNNSPGSSTLQQTISLNDTRQWNPRFTTNLDVNHSQNSSTFTGGDVRREQLDVNFRAIGDLQKAQARLDYIRSIPIGESSRFFSTSDVTPALTFLSDSRRLFGQAFDARFPFQAQISYGEYGDPITSGRLTRADLDLNFQNPRSAAAPGKKWVVTYQGQFKQDTYSNDTAQYILRASTQFLYKFKNDSRFRLNYNYLRPYGFTPLQIDRRGNAHNIVSDLSYSPVRNMLLGVATGYDFNLIKQHQPTPWQQVGLLARYTLGNYFEARALSTYDTSRHAYSSTRLDLTWIPGSTYVSFGAKYDGIRNKWAAANLFVDGFKTGRLRTSLLFNYNGYTRKFDAQHYSFIYDLHCAEAVLQIIDNSAGFNSGRQIYFFVRLKALPFDTPFGSGQRGQPIGTGTGRDF